MRKPNIIIMSLGIVFFTIYSFMALYVYTGGETTGIENVTIHMMDPNPTLGYGIFIFGVLHLVVVVVCSFMGSQRKSLELRKEGIEL
jgi:hypothetical protein